jgi:hypothetical protein
LEPAVLSLQRGSWLPHNPSRRRHTQLPLGQAPRVHDSAVRQGPRSHIQLLLMQDVQHELGVRAVQGWLSQGARHAPAPHESQTDVGVLLLHEEGFVQDI